jgi:thiol:disulfide interchange protein DsbA
MFQRLLLALGLLFPVVALAQPAPAAAPREGVDYVVLPTPQPTWNQGNQIEVVEVFGYTCPHCAHFQPLVNSWKARLPADVRFGYVPAAFGGPWDNYARAYLAAEAMNVLPRTHDAVFRAFHVERRLNPASTLTQISELYGSLGVDRARFLAAMNSTTTSARLGRARQFAMRTGVDSTPTIVIAGKYRVMVTRDRGFAGMLATVDYLIARERAARRAPAPAPAPAPAR